MRLEELERIRKLKIRLAKMDFWEYCRLEDPEFYSEDRVYLRNFAKLLQAFYERRIQRISMGSREDNFGWMVREERIEAWETCQRLIVNMPPRHGKTRTVALFESWILGKDQENRIITGSYNDDTAADLSRMVRDKVSEAPQNRWKVPFSEVFHGVKLKTGDSSVKRWALEGQFFNYMAAGIGGSATGKGCSLLVIDDPIKNAEEAFNAGTMAGVRSWITDTMLSRMEGDALFFIVMTRWPGQDPVEEFLDERNPNANLYYQLSMPAHLGDGVMLNPDVLSYKTYCERKVDTDEMVFSANYDQEIITPSNSLYRKLSCYEQLPRDVEGKELFDARLAYIDSADGGGDYTCAIAAIEWQKDLYVTGVVYESGPAEDIEPMVADMLVATDTREACFESNSGGKAFAKGVEKHLQAKNVRTVGIEWIHQSANKESRILTNAAAVQKRVFYPLDWKARWPEYAKAMTKYLRVGRNKHDDAPDATTGLVEFSDNRGVILL